MKYDSQIAELKNLLPSVKSILITLPTVSNIDKFAAGLALFLVLKAASKEVSIVCDDTILVAQSHLFGVDHIQKNLPPTSGGNLTVTLGGVAAANNTVPALQKLDWYAENSNLNLVFHVVPGQTFQPTSVVPHYQGSGFNLIFAIGAANLNNLGNVYMQNTAIFSGVHIVNIDNQAINTGYGTSNVLDQTAPALSEIMVDLISSLGLPFDNDTASNLLAGIFEVTANLTSENLTADTFMAVASCLRVGGKKPVSIQTVSSQVPPAQTTPGFDLSVLMPPLPNVQTTVGSSSPEERPQFEGLAPAETLEPEPGWLTPKVFKGTSVG